MGLSQSPLGLNHLQVSRAPGRCCRTAPCGGSVPGVRVKSGCHGVPRAGVFSAHPQACPRSTSSCQSAHHRLVRKTRGPDALPGPQGGAAGPALGMPRVVSQLSALGLGSCHLRLRPVTVTCHLQSSSPRCWEVWVLPSKVRTAEVRGP